MKKTRITLKKIWKDIFREYIYCNHFMSLGAAAVGLITSYLAGLNSFFINTLSIYFFVQCIYWVDRIFDYERNKLGVSEKLRHIKDRFASIVLGCFVYITLFIIGNVLTENYRGLIIGLVLFLFGSSYGVFFRKITMKIPGFKNYFVSVFFALFAVYVVVITDTKFDLVLLAIFILYVLWRSVLIQMFFDLHDVSEDMREGLKTYPILIGRLPALRAMYILNLLSGLPILVGIIINIVPIWLIVIIIPIIIYSWSIKKVKTELRREYFIYVGHEYILTGALAFVAKSLYDFFI